MAEEHTIDFGEGYVGRYYGWDPDVELNPQYEGLAPLEKAGLLLRCGPHGTEGGVPFSLAGYEVLWQDRAAWTVESWEPLTLEPSIAASCGCHGWIRGGRWISA